MAAKKRDHGTDRIYYLVGKKSPVMDVINAIIAKNAAFVGAARAFKKKWAADSIWTTGPRVSGLSFDGDVPEGWRKRLDGCCTPDYRTKRGREIRKELEALDAGVDGWAQAAMFAKAGGGEWVHWAESKVMFTVYERIGNQYVLSVPLGCKQKPPECRELKMSELWKLREKAAA